MPNPWIIVAVLLVIGGIGGWGVTESWRADRAEKRILTIERDLGDKRAQAELEWSGRLAAALATRTEAQAELARRGADTARFLAGELAKVKTDARVPETGPCTLPPAARDGLGRLRERAAARRGAGAGAAAGAPGAARALPAAGGA